MPVSKKNFLREIAIAGSAAGAIAVAAPAAMAMPTTADVLVVVDESLSMAGEQAWIANMIPDLDAALNTAGITNNRFGLVGFVENNGAHGPGSEGPHKHLYGGNDWTTSANFGSPDVALTDDGSILEDGYEAIKFGLISYSFRANAALNIILVTDEDWDDTGADDLPTVTGITAASLRMDLAAKNAKVNVVVRNPFTDDNSMSALGQDSDGNWYKADGSGGYTSGAGGVIGNGHGNTENDYVRNLALHADIGGAAWDLTQLRNANGTNMLAESFTAAFVDVKVEEISTQIPVPAPGSLLIFGLSLLGLGLARRKGLI